MRTTAFVVSLVAVGALATVTPRVAWGQCTGDLDEDGDTYTCDDGDCNDQDPDMHPGHDELCDGKDNNCASSTSDDGADECSGGTAYCCGPELASNACRECCTASQCGAGDWTCPTTSYTCQCAGIVCNGECIADGECCVDGDCLDASHTGSWTCNGSNQCECDLVDCGGNCQAGNACGGCDDIPAGHEPGVSCGSGGGCGQYVCDADDEGTHCVDPGDNDCGGCTVLTGEIGDDCGANNCGELECAQNLESLVCVGDHALNACDGCSTLAHTIGDLCSGTPEACDYWDCDGPNDMTCVDPGENVCGTCPTISGDIGDPCGNCGTRDCAPDNLSLVCVGDHALNECDGCSTLDHAVGELCPGDPPCDYYVCDGLNDLTCFDPGLNECGTCPTLSGSVGDACGTHGCGLLECAGDNLSLVCVGDHERNQCGGCDTDLPDQVPGTACPGECASWVCVTPNQIECQEVGYTTYYYDGDGDGWGLEADSVEACAAEGMYRATQVEDCDDEDPLNFPGNTEVCDGQDNNCNDEIDEGLSSDRDHDGSLECGGCAPDPPDCDCDDDDNSIFPGATEQCDCVDRDCDGNRHNGFPDLDSDGVPDCSGPTGDCNDDPAQHGELGRPAWCGLQPFVEVCDGVDNDCAGGVDNDLTRADCYTGPAGTLGVGRCQAGNGSCTAVPGSGVEDWSGCVGEVVPSNDDPLTLDETSCDGVDDDCDGVVDDGFDADRDGVRSCISCAGVIPADECDCDDSRPDVKPGGIEICDGLDNDCNGFEDDDGAGGLLSEPCYTGPDGTEGIGECQPGGALCEGGEISLVCTGQVVPAAADDCDGLDEDCNGIIDDGWDADEDGFTSCGDDCDDTNPDMYPGNLEICDGLDNDCDGVIDGVETPCYSGPRETLDVGICHAGTSLCEDAVPVGECVGEQTPEDETCDGTDEDCDGEVDEDFDLDQDGYASCDACPGLPPDQCDCDDLDGNNHPSAREYCDCQDNNCDGIVDIYPYLDENLETQMRNACEGGACHDIDGDNVSSCDGDCDDYHTQVGPGFVEIFGNGRDDDCDGAIDEDVDEDLDGVSIGAGDCDDRFAEIYPGAEEVCDGFDNNCAAAVDFECLDGRVLPSVAIDEGFDADCDGVTVCAGDCDDTDPDRSPKRKEVCGDGKDNDCNGLVDEETDYDGDGVTNCQGDCNDYNPAVFPAVGDAPAAPEICDGQDNDCAGAWTDCPDGSRKFSAIDEGYDFDCDGFAICLGDCNDTDPEISPEVLEVPGDGVDNDCDGAIDEGEDDLDGDGFSFNCGDCDDSNPAIHPHAEELCDRIDNNCDGYRDSFLGQPDLCDICFDADQDGFTNCEGDCDDSEPSVYPGAPEICDELDNDCDHAVDLDPDGLTVCTGEDDAGVSEDAAGGDGGATGLDSGVVVTVDAGGGSAEPDNAGRLLVGCHCAATEGRGGLMVGLLLAGVAIGLTGRRRRGLLLLLAAVGLLALVGCDGGIEVPGLVASDIDGGVGPTDGGTTGTDLVGRDLGGRDLAGRDQTPSDLSTAPCPTNGVVSQTTQLIPGTALPFAIPPSLELATLGGIEGFALDNVEAEVAAFVIRRALPDTMDPEDPDALYAFGDEELGALDRMPGAPTSGRIEEHRRTFVDPWGRPGVTTVQRIELASARTAVAVRNNALGGFAHVLPTMIDGLPAIPVAASVAREHLLHLLFIADPEGIVVVGAVTTQARHASNQILLRDLANSTHVGFFRSELRNTCEVRTLPELLTDFLWVIDNSSSMQEEQNALAAAAAAFFNALQASGLDFRLGVTTTDGEVLRGDGFTRSLDTFERDVQVGINGNGRELGLEYGLLAIEAASGATDPARQLREEAAHIVIFVSDEDSTNLRPLDDYADDYAASEAIVFGIVGPNPLGCMRVGLGIANAGRSYIEVAERTGGATGSICNPNLSETITAILLGAAGAASRSPLGALPVSNSLAVRVESESSGAREPWPRGRVNGFDYEASGNTVLFFGDAETLPDVGTLFEVAFEYFAPISG